MDIFEALRIDHAAIRGLLDEIIDSTTGMSPTAESGARDWPELFHDFKVSLIAHNRAEEAVLYNALSGLPHRTELSEIKTEEHHLAESMLADVELLNPQDNEWESRLGLLQNQIESHIAEEETLVFAILQENLSSEEAERMAAEFETLRDEIRQGVPYHPKGRSVINPEGVRLDT